MESLQPVVTQRSLLMRQ